MGSMTSVIPAATVGVKDMADSSLRITLEFEPRHAREAYALFGARGTPVAVVALKVGYEQKVDPLPGPAHKAAENVHVGGPLARLAGQWCADPAFREWIYVDTEAQAAEKIRAFCKIESRRLLDHDLEAATKFKKLFRTPYMAHIKDGAL